MPQDEFFMGCALALAKKAMSWTNPNPMVGAIIARRGKIIGKGYHKRVGLPHAEIVALQAAKTAVYGATLYINLEPCTHYGRTPPCVDAVIQSGIKRVVCATADPNPKVGGLGIIKLKQAGIAVSLGVKEKEAKALNEAFFTFHEKKRPFIALKFAASLDGKIATYAGDSKWITNEGARTFARKLRGEYQAVLVGINTVLSDDPHLGVRSRGKRDPLRIILDSTLRIPLDSCVLRDDNCLIIATTRASKEKQERFKMENIPVFIVDGEHIHLKELLSILKSQEIISVLVEGGGKILGNFIDARLADRLYAFFAPILIGGEKATATGGIGIKKIADALYFKKTIVKRLQDNLVVIGSSN